MITKVKHTSIDNTAAIEAAGQVMADLGQDFGDTSRTSQVAALLADYLNAGEAERRLLVAAYRYGVVHELQAAQTPSEAECVLASAIQQLCSQHFSSEGAEFAVRCWAAALGTALPNSTRLSQAPTVVSPVTSPATMRSKSLVVVAVCAVGLVVLLASWRKGSDVDEAVVHQSISAKQAVESVPEVSAMRTIPMQVEEKHVVPTPIPPIASVPPIHQPAVASATVPLAARQPITTDHVVVPTPEAIFDDSDWPSVASNPFEERLPPCNTQSAATATDLPETEPVLNIAWLPCSATSLRSELLGMSLENQGQVQFFAPTNTRLELGTGDHPNYGSGGSDDSGLPNHVFSHRPHTCQLVSWSEKRCWFVWYYPHDGHWLLDGYEVNLTRLKFQRVIYLYATEADSWWTASAETVIDDQPIELAVSTALGKENLETITVAFYGPDQAQGLITSFVSRTPEEHTQRAHNFAAADSR